MNFETVKSWLAKWTDKQMKNCRLLGILGFVLTPIALILATTCVYWLLRLFMHDPAGNLGDPTKCFLISLAIIPCLFIGNRFVPRRDLMEEQLTEGRTVRRGEVMSVIFFWLMFTGPRLFNWAFRSLSEARRWRQMDVHSCAAVFWLLMSKLGKISLADMQQQLEWLKLDEISSDLHRISGIVFLQAPPPGLSLTQDFREQIRSEAVY